ncbi:MAG: FadR/GntR family transcriptional regulator [Devosia sp.]|nr:FadR/GntR family transcriptional regulator [Devosia sp.]
MSDDVVLLADRSAPTRLSGAVYDGILQLIASGELPLNARLPSEVRLSVMFDASRPVVREALARMREDGLVVSRRGSGSYVTRQPDLAVLQPNPVGSIADVQRCFEFRAGVEPAAARLAAVRWEPEDMRRIDEAMAALERCIADAAGLGADEDNRLHQAIADATHNQYHTLVQSSLRSHIAAGMNITRSLSLMRPEIRVRQVQDEHVAIVEAVRQRDPDAAFRFMEAHILNARRRMFEGVGR